MNIYNYLKKDHRKVSKMMEDLLDTQDGAKRMEIFEEIKTELLLHAKTEQATFYKALENRKPTEEWIEEAQGEHKEVEAYLKKLSSLPFNSEKWIEQFGEFKHAVSHHVEEEEDVIFPKAKKILSDKRANEIAEEMEELKQDAKTIRKVQAAA